MALWQHQEDAIAWAWNRQNVIWHHGMGSGKTRTTLTYLLRKLEAAGWSRALVCCPKAVIAAWVKQVGLWAPGVRIVALEKGTSAQKEKQLREALAAPGPVIVVCNYETIWRIKLAEKTSWDFLIWDEVHRLKSPSGVASRWAGRMRAKNKQAVAIGLTGTLIPHSVLDLQPIYRAVEAPECPTFGQSMTMHRARHAVFSNGPQKFVVGYRNLPEAHAKVAATTHHVRSQDVLDLPPIQYIDVQADLTPAEAKVYAELEKEFCFVCEGGLVTPKNALERLLRMQQTCGGYIRYDDTPAAQKICEHPAKATMLRDMLEDLPEAEPVVIFCRFRSDIESARAACESLKRSVSELSGERSELADWQRGDTTALVVQIQSGGIGIDLTRASYCWFFSLGYSLAEYEQAVARLHRPGQERRTVIYHLISTIQGRSTVDGKVYEALRERRDVVQSIISGYGAAAPVGAR
jgi:SNF2 family DNA or RNA helicase